MIESHLIQHTGTPNYVLKFNIPSPKYNFSDSKSQEHLASRIEPIFLILMLIIDNQIIKRLNIVARYSRNFSREAYNSQKRVFIVITIGSSAIDSLPQVTKNPFTKIERFSFLKKLTLDGI